MTRVFDTTVDTKLIYTSPAQNESALILLRSKLSVVADRLGISELKRENMLLVASELVSNNIKHAGGRGLIQIWQQPGPILDIVALDYGPGIADIRRAEKDGYSSVNTLGKGLGTIRRLSDESYIYTQRESTGQVKKWSGTVFLARFHLGNVHKTASGLQVGIFSRSLSDERYNGDRVYWQKTPSLLRWLHLDGLGHGELAQNATAHLSSHLASGDDPAQVLISVDRQLAGSRGAVGVVGEIDLQSQKISIHGMGDMHAHIFSEDQMQHISFAPGVLGKEHRTTTTTTADFCRKCVVVTASDGIRRNWDTGNFTGLFNQHPQLIAYTLGNIMGRISDDQSLCVASIV